ncbi:hypothetical protein FA15DRAFT_262443 [Coprinopsis marcescibilis]|uniref:Secreted protein n=1 Tax=Coprinopsis marcescibilis TaxID=230819 RepID=A0A5C3L377_COPMA|nr:hypothetical protein FA15DRAFT_262443 [Coprinopsis marcescibilis]
MVAGFKSAVFTLLALAVLVPAKPVAVVGEQGVKVCSPVHVRCFMVQLKLFVRRTRLKPWITNLRSVGSPNQSTTAEPKGLSSSDRQATRRTGRGARSRVPSHRVLLDAGATRLTRVCDGDWP